MQYNNIIMQLPRSSNETKVITYGFVFGRNRVVCYLFQDRLRKSEALKDELTKFLQEHGNLVSWLEQSEEELHSLGEGEIDAQELKGRLEQHRKVLRISVSMAQSNVFKYSL